MERKMIMSWGLASLMVFFFGAGAWGAEGRMEELRAKFEQRYPAIQQMKSAGKIGETSEGMIDAVKASDRAEAAVMKLVQEENSDRAELYRLIAAKTNATPEVVAKRNAEKRFAKAKPGEWLRGEDGVWRQK